jgi:hypothetical protein
LIWISGPVRDSFGVVTAGNIMEHRVSTPRASARLGRGTGIGIAEGVALNGSRLDRTSGRHPVPACRATVRGG